MDCSGDGDSQGETGDSPVEDPIARTLEAISKTAEEQSKLIAHLQEQRDRLNQNLARVERQIEDAHEVLRRANRATDAMSGQDQFSNKSTPSMPMPPGYGKIASGRIEA